MNDGNEITRLLGIYHPIYTDIRYRVYYKYVIYMLQVKINGDGGVYMEGKKRRKI